MITSSDAPIHYNQESGLDFQWLSSFVVRHFLVGVVVFVIFIVIETFIAGTILQRSIQLFFALRLHTQSNGMSERSHIKLVLVRLRF